jgi:hypothetical protein
MIRRRSIDHFIILGFASVIHASSGIDLVNIGGVPLESSAGFLTLWRPTFETYLSETVGIKYSPPLRFSLITLTLSTAFDMVEAGNVSFVFSNPSLFSCLQAEYSGPYNHYSD